MINGLPEKLKKLRRLNRLSQQQAADRLGVSPSVISGYETGERTPSTEVLLSLSYLYNCSTDYLLGRQNDEPDVVLSTSGLTDEQIKAIAALLEAIKNK